MYIPHPRTPSERVRKKHELKTADSVLASRDRVAKCLFRCCAEMSLHPWMLLILSAFVHVLHDVVFHGGARVRHPVGCHATEVARTHGTASQTSHTSPRIPCPRYRSVHLRLYVCHAAASNMGSGPLVFNQPAAFRLEAHWDECCDCRRGSFPNIARGAGHVAGRRVMVNVRLLVKGWQPC